MQTHSEYSDDNMFESDVEGDDDILLPEEIMDTQQINLQVKSIEDKIKLSLIEKVEEEAEE
jgi:hypothetical protein